MSKCVRNDPTLKVQTTVYIVVSSSLFNLVELATRLLIAHNGRL
jgi:hypothetical protein